MLLIQSKTAEITGYMVVRKLCNYFENQDSSPPGIGNHSRIWVSSLGPIGFLPPKDFPIFHISRYL
jgi:hypothetical protein